MSDVEATQPGTSAHRTDSTERIERSTQPLDDVSKAWTGWDLDGVSPAGPLRMPSTGDHETVDLQPSLRRFHFTGERSGSELDSSSRAPWRPAVLAPWLTPGPMWSDGLLFVPKADAEEAGIVTLASLLRKALASSQENDSETDVLEEQLWRLTRATAHALEARGGSSPFRDVIDEGKKVFLEDVLVVAADRDALEARLARLDEALPREGTLMGMGRNLAIDLYSTIVGRHRRTAQHSFRADAKGLTVQLKDRLQIDRIHSAEGATPEHLSEAMGGAAESYLDTDVLAGSLPAYRGTRSIEPNRLRRMEQTVQVLEHYFDKADAGADFVLMHSDDLPEGLCLPADTSVRHVDGLAAAVDIFNDIAGELVSVVRALRTARLDLADQYDPALHDAPMARLDRDSLTAQERTLARAVVVLEWAETLQGNKISSLSRVLQSGLPIHVLVMGNPLDLSRADADTALGSADPGLGYRSIAHREAFVLQTTVVQPGHLARGLEDMVRSVGPAVAFIEGHPWTTRDASPWLHSVAEHQGRASPCFQYVPDAGDSWATRFILSGNPQPDEAWPRYTVPYIGAGDEAMELALQFTFVECVALNPAFGDHFCVIPTAAWGEGQVELSEYLGAAAAEPSPAVPYIWVVDEDGLLQRAVVTRDLVLACWERMRAWHILQELGGIENEYASRAVSRVKAESQEALEALRNELEVAHAADVERIRAEVVEETVQRVVAGLLGLDSVPPPSVAAPQAMPPPAAAPAQEDVVEAAETVAVEDPYIDTPLCTTCDECTNINPRLFKYDDNKQAYIADPTAGTFRELVKAAIACPACIIHPGSPRPDDQTATDALRAKAAEFN